MTSLDLAMYGFAFCHLSVIRFFCFQVVDCGDPGQAVNGITNITDASRYKSVVTYKCLTGYIKERGWFTRECIANETHAMWTGSTLVCKRTYAKVNFVRNCGIYHKDGLLVVFKKSAIRL